MKRFAFYLGIATAMVASCSTQEEDIQTPVQDDVIYYASFEQPAEEGTRVYANEDLLLRWTADDRVSIFGKITYNQQYRFLGETGDNSGGFSKVDGAEYVTGNPISHTVSVYPYQEGTKISEKEVLTLTLPAEQHYAENTFGLGSNTMVSVSSDNVLQYKNVCGYLALKLYGEGVTVSSIALEGNKGEKLAGQAFVNMPLDGVPSVEMGDNSTEVITLTCSTPIALGSTADESKEFWFVIPPVTFSEGFTITVEDSQNRIFKKSTTASLQIGRNTLKRMSPLKTEFSDSEEAVDLGLSVKWATCNIGASAPEGYGDYFAWAEIETYYEKGYAQESPQAHWKSGKESGYDWRWSNYSWYADNQFTKYCTTAEKGIVDGKTVLDLTEDAANVSMGGIWRLPTDSEWTELRENCSWEWTSVNGVNGYRVSGNGQSIFLPAAGYRDGTNLLSLGTNGLYWSSSACRTNSNYAWDVYFNSGSISRDDFDRYYGLAIRPVYGEYIVASGLSLSDSSLDLIEGDTVQLGAVLSPTDCLEKNILWESSDPSVATVSDEGVITAVSVGSATVSATWAGNAAVRADCLVTVAQNTIITFEDAAFKAFCVDHYDVDRDGEVCFDEVDDVTEMTVCTDNITSLAGIEHFVSLRSLTCSGTSYDSEFGGSGKLSAIDLSHNTRLTYLDCSANQLEKLDLTDNQALSVVKCTGNPLLTLDISRNPSIETLYAEDMDRLVVIFVSDAFEESSHPGYHKEPTAIYLAKDPTVDEYVADDGFGQEFTFPGDTDCSVSFAGRFSTTSGWSSDYGSYFGMKVYANETSNTIIGEIRTGEMTYKLIQKPVLLHNDAIYYRNSSSYTGVNSRIKNPSNCYDIAGNKLSIVSRRIVPGNRCKIQYSGEVYSIGDNAFSVTSVGEGSSSQAQLCCIWLPYSVKEVGASSFSYTVSGKTLWQLCGFDRVDKVSSYSFYGLGTYLPEFTFNYKMTEVPDGLFGKCIAKKIIVPEGVTRIGRSSFSDYNYSLNTIVLPSTLTEIGTWAFGNTKPYEIYAYMTTPPDYSSWSYTYSEGTRLHVPRGCSANYSQWTNQVGKNRWTVIEDL